MWVVWALAAMLSFASNNFLLSAVAQEASEPSAANVSGIIVVWIVAGVAGLSALLVGGASQILREAGGAHNVRILLATGVMNTAAMLCLTLALASDPDSAGPITAMLPLNSVLVCALAWTILGEKLGMQDLLGIGVAVAGPVCMAIADTSGAALRGLLFGVSTAACFGGSNFLRKLAKSNGATNRSIVVLLYLTIGAAAVVALLVCFISGRGLRGFDQPRLLFFAAASGMLWVLGGIFFQQALMGLAGPASAVTNTNSVGVLALSCIFFKPEIKALKIVGMALCIIGVTLLSLKKRPPAARDFERSNDSAMSLQGALSTHGRTTG